MRSIDWDSPTWGGHVHEDPRGSWVGESPKEEL